MRIAIFSDSFLPGVGGTEKAVFGLANELAKNNDVAVFCPKYDGKSSDDYNFSVFRANNIKVCGEYYGLPYLTGKLSKKLKEFDPDIIHCQTVSSLTRFGLDYAKKHNIPAIMTIHTKFREAFGRVVKVKTVLNIMLKDIAFKAAKCDKVFTVSGDMGRELKTYGYEGEFEVIKNGSSFELPQNLDFLSDNADKMFNLQGKIVFLFVGLIAKFKNLEFSLNALKELKKTRDDFSFVIVGKGPHEEYFKTLVKKLELENNVVFTGLVKEKEILSSLYARANLFLFPSIFDNDPLTIVEAAMHSTPSIVIVNTGSSERIENDFSGFVIENNLNDFVEKLVFLSSNLHILKEVGKNATEKVPKTWKQIADEYLRQYKELVEEFKQIELEENSVKQYALKKF